MEVSTRKSDVMYGVVLASKIIGEAVKNCQKENGRRPFVANSEGERGPYEIAIGRDPMLFISTMEKFANQGGMLSEQLWDAEDLPESVMRLGLPTGAAMPLCWSHAEYVSLVRSAHDGICFDRVEPAFQRYVVNPVPSRHEICSFRHQLRRLPHGRILRIIVAEDATLVWSANDWVSTNRAGTIHNSLLDLCSQIFQRRTTLAV